MPISAEGISPLAHVCKRSQVSSQHGIAVAYNCVDCNVGPTDVTSICHMHEVCAAEALFPALPSIASMLFVCHKLVQLKGTQLAHHHVSSSNTACACNCSWEQLLSFCNQQVLTSIHQPVQL